MIRSYDFVLYDFPLPQQGNVLCIMESQDQKKLQNISFLSYHTSRHKTSEKSVVPVLAPRKRQYLHVSGKAVSLTAETVDGRSTFRVRVAPPEGKSYARGIAEKYGVTYEDLTGGT